MHTLFSDWYLVANPLATRETIEMRWAALEGIAALSIERAGELAACVVRPKLATPEWFRAAFKAADPQMPTRGVEEELRILAAATLRVAMAVEGKISATAALSLLAGAFGMKDEPRWLKEHLHAAVAQLAAAGTAARVVAPLSVLALTLEEVNSGFAVAQRMIGGLAEANDYLWWAFAGQSEIFGEAYKTMPASVVSLVAPVDIFAFVRTLPPTPETETLLLNVLTGTASTKEPDLSFKNYLSSLGRERAVKIVRHIPESCAALCPVLWSIEATSTARSWVAEFEKSFGFRTSNKFPVQAVAVQLLRELCLVKIFA